MEFKVFSFQFYVGRFSKHGKRLIRRDLWIGLMLFAGFFALISPPFREFVLPTLACLGLLTVLDSLEVDSALPQPPDEAVERELMWLFGDQVETHNSPEAYIIAQSRVARQRVGRSLFVIHLVSFIGLLGLFIYMSVHAYRSLNLMEVDDLLFVVGMWTVWLALLTLHGYMSFPSQARLARREQQIGEAILVEMQRSTPDIGKHKEKPKNDAQYRIGEDGELEAVDDEFTPDEDEKSKRNDYGI